MTAELADTVLDGFYGRAGAGGAGAARPAPSLEAIQDTVCDAFAITREELMSPSRAARLVWPRQVAMYLARENTDLTFPDIARRFGRRNHTTVMYACRKAGERLAADPAAQALVHDLERRLGEPPQ
jgi:chromosomal replication initiator protein